MRKYFAPVILIALVLVAAWWSSQRGPTKRSLRDNGKASTGHNVGEAELAQLSIVVFPPETYRIRVTQDGALEHDEQAGHERTIADLEEGTCSVEVGHPRLGTIERRLSLFPGEQVAEFGFSPTAEIRGTVEFDARRRQPRVYLEAHESLGPAERRRQLVDVTKVDEGQLEFSCSNLWPGVYKLEARWHDSILDGALVECEVNGDKKHVLLRTIEDADTPLSGTVYLDGHELARTKVHFRVVCSNRGDVHGECETDDRGRYAYPYAVFVGDADRALFWTLKSDVASVPLPGPPPWTKIDPRLTSQDPTTVTLETHTGEVVRGGSLRISSDGRTQRYTTNLCGQVEVSGSSGPASVRVDVPQLGVRAEGADLSRRGPGWKNLLVDLYSESVRLRLPRPVDSFGVPHQIATITLQWAGEPTAGSVCLSASASTQLPLGQQTVLLHRAKDAPPEVSLIGMGVSPEGQPLLGRCALRSLDTDSNLVIPLQPVETLKVHGPNDLMLALGRDQLRWDRGGLETASERTRVRPGEKLDTFCFNAREDGKYEIYLPDWISRDSCWLVSPSRGTSCVGDLVNSNTTADAMSALSWKRTVAGRLDGGGHLLCRLTLTLASGKELRGVAHPSTGHHFAFPLRSGERPDHLVVYVGGSQVERSFSDLRVGPGNTLRLEH